MLRFFFSGVKLSASSTPPVKTRMLVLFFVPSYDFTKLKHVSGQIPIVPKPELRALLGDSLTKPPFGVTSAEVAIICPDV